MMAGRRKFSGRPLTAAFVRTVKRPGRYGDGRGGYGLSLLVKVQKNGRISRTWSQRFIDSTTGKPRMIGLGAYPVVTLAQARKMALAHAREIKAGRDPRGGGVPTFEAATSKVIAFHSKGWKAGSRTEAIWRSGFATHVYPKLGSKRVDKITTADLMKVLGPIWHAKPSQAQLVRRRIGQVMRWAVAQGLRPDNPAGEALAAALPKNGKTTKHHRALDHSRVANALAKVDGSSAVPATKLAIRFLVATATRTGETRGARWSEIETDAAIWTIPGDRTKTQRPFRVALSSMALDTLAEARERWGDSGLVFPGRGGNPIGEVSMRALFKSLDLGGTPHGLRSSFRDWCGETGVPREVAEACLAHVVGGVEGAYARSDLLERRRDVMEAWSRYLTS